MSWGQSKLPLFDQQSNSNNIVHTQGIEFFRKYECDRVQIFFLKKNTLFKRLTDQLKWKLFYCYVMRMELTRGEDKFNFASFILFEIFFKKYLKVKSNLSMTFVLGEGI